MSTTNGTRDDTEDLTIMVFSGQRTHELADPLRETENEVIVVSKPSSSLIERAIYATQFGQRELRRRDVDLLIGNSAGVMSFIAALLGAIFRTPFVLRLGGNIWEINREKLREYIANRTYRGAIIISVLMVMNRVTFNLCSGYLAISETVEEAIVENTGIARQRIGRMGVPLNYESFADAQPALPTPPGEIGSGRVLITVTNLRFRKKYEALHDSLPLLERVLADHEEIEYIVAGDGTYLEPLRNDADTIFSDDVRPRVHFPGYVDDVKGLYQAADAMVYVSYAEGFGNIVQEAMAAGCPVVVNNCEGLGEQIEQGDTGFLVDSPTDPAIPNMIERAIYDQDRIRIIENAQYYVQTASEPKAIGEQLIGELRTLLGGSERA